MRRSQFTSVFLALLLFCGLAHGEAGGKGYVGAQRCAACHREAFENWRGSHHDLAMQAPSDASVLGDFDGARFVYNGVETRFFRRGGDFVVRTDGPDGALQDYTVAWVFGVYPLQQYLLPLPGGRLQALSVAWDSRPLEEGGQRWYHLYPDEQVDHRDPLHWTGPYQNWNTRCAECHSTDLEKNYLAGNRSFASRFAEEDVACEACHGPGAEHLRLAEAGEDSSGALLSLAQRGDWSFEDGAPIATRREPLADQRQVDNCGRCHARRGTLGTYRHGQPLSATHRLSLLGQPLYHHDGQILDEVYVYGSFVQSRMYRAGVVCSNCHEPHSNQLRADGNGVCTQCHRGEVYDAPSHHRHAATGSGAQCVACHMPDRVYMGVDSRRDHSLRIPRPDLTLMAGTPNACNDCHNDRDAGWALEALRAWGKAPSDTARHPALAMQAVDRGDTRGVPRLMQLAADPEASAIWRATALERSAAAGSNDAMALATQLLLADEPLLRVSAVRSLEALPLPRRFAALYPLHRDPVLGVRMAVAEVLAPVPLDELNVSRREAMEALFAEYLAVQSLHLDMPSVQLQLGIFHSAQGQTALAEDAYREALRMNPQLIAGRLNLADLLRAAGREEDARRELHSALKTAPQSGDVQHALGLLEIRSGNLNKALEYLAAAAALDGASPRHRFVYAIALHDTGDAAGALRELRALLRELPADEQALLALANYSAEGGDLRAARDYVERLQRLAPQNPAYRDMLRALKARG
jgi:predicted CXXCH cytochrome family protein